MPTEAVRMSVGKDSLKSEQDVCSIHFKPLGDLYWVNVYTQGRVDLQGVQKFVSIVIPPLTLSHVDVC